MCAFVKLLICTYVVVIHYIKLSTVLSYNYFVILMFVKVDVSKAAFAGNDCRLHI